MFLLTVFIVLASSIWVYNDAKSMANRATEIGIENAYTPRFAAFMVLVFWIVCFPVYIHQRNIVLKDLDDIDGSNSNYDAPWVVYAVGVAPLISLFV